MIIGYKNYLLILMTAGKDETLKNSSVFAKKSILLQISTANSYIRVIFLS